MGEVVPRAGRSCRQTAPNRVGACPRILLRPFSGARRRGYAAVHRHRRNRGSRRLPGQSGLGYDGPPCVGEPLVVPAHTASYRPAKGLSVGNLSNFLGNQPRLADVKWRSALCELRLALKPLARLRIQTLAKFAWLVALSWLRACVRQRSRPEYTAEAYAAPSPLGRTARARSRGDDRALAKRCPQRQPFLAVVRRPPAHRPAIR